MKTPGKASKQSAVASRTDTDPETKPLGKLLNAAERSLGTTAAWVRVRLSEAAQIDGSLHYRVSVSPLDPVDVERGTKDVWEGRIWMKDVERVVALVGWADAATPQGIAVEALLQIEVNHKAGMVMVVRSVRV